MTNRLAAALGLTVIVAACIEPLDPPREKVGFVSLNVFAESLGGAAVMRPVGAFYRFDGLALRTYSTDTCFFATYTSVQPATSLPTLPAGDRIVTNLSGRTDTLHRTVAGSVLLYEYLRLLSIYYTPGDTASIAVQGDPAGFPAGSLKVKTVEAFQLNPIDTATRELPMAVTWGAPTVGGSRMTLSFRHASTTGSSTADRQIYCDVADDGAYHLPAAMADVFRNSPYELRSVFASRVRTATVDLGDFTKLHLISMYDDPLTVYVPPTSSAIGRVP